ncbi:MAG: Holliday junction branch migration protein RuvA [Smithellaceae bacterium]|jgi:Holliday junction DNA helicase RuvA|nr:Holliday junction branch migration protein RuvA [Smithellaceae bacterium]HBJ75442.1 Holliday junction branch migration protein RuvA [Syntrophaceae bacterium]MDD5413498.1 Holliday junction branch migration protein RuvA [Smithellaceae bacterium]HBL53730.1 Holliday junction branch migration protein RuvA [Syntrophaceae bacterium]HCS77819.1 Holliday junction branch migration protein RuvA [Syntrophaceae bacterium]
MIALLSGKIAYKGISHLVVETQGVGYRVFIPLTTFYELPEAGQTITLHIHTSVKEDAIHLFGFYTREERELFQMMISVSGIGPKVAMNILSGISSAELLEAISGGHLAKLITIPGIGRKMAERLILELKDKAIKKMAADRIPATDAKRKLSESIREDVLSALVNLGYKANAARDAVDKVARDTQEESAMDQLLKKALKILAG